MPPAPEPAYVWHVWWIAGMVKTTVYLPDADMQALKAAARRRHQPEAELIREGIRWVLAEEASPVSAADIDAALAAGSGGAAIER
jgi:hypothetical protein